MFIYSAENGRQKYLNGVQRVLIVGLGFPLPILLCVEYNVSYMFSNPIQKLNLPKKNINDDNNRIAGQSGSSFN